MKLYYDQINLPLIEDQYLSVLQIESSELLLKFTKAIMINLVENNENFYLAHNNLSLEFNKFCEWIDSPWKLDLKNRRLQNTYINHLAKTILDNNEDEQIFQKWIELHELISTFIIEEALVNIELNNLALTEILKAFSVQANISYELNMVELLEEYILFQTKYGDVKLFIITFLSNYISNNDLNELIRFCNSEKIYVLLIEHFLPPRFSIINCRYIIIDEDLCEIIVNES